MNINYLRNFYVSRVTYLTTPGSAPDAIHFTETQQYILFVYVARYTRENLTTCQQDVFATGL
jgi:hypothetical protein